MIGVPAKPVEILNPSHLAEGTSPVSARSVPVYNRTYLMSHSSLSTALSLCFPSSSSNLSARAIAVCVSLINRPFGVTYSCWNSVRSLV